MDGILFDLGLPDEILETIIEKAGGRRLRIAKSGSKHNRLFREKRNKKICQMGLTGATLDDLEKEFKLRKRRINEILKENGIRLREGKKGSLTEVIKALRQIGYNKKQIAKKLDVSRTTIYTHMKREGIQ